jgi:hypothetical protein
MGRPRSGSVRKRWNRWLGSVPTFDNSTRRPEYAFDTEDEAWSWVRAQLECLDQGIAPERPPTARRPGRPSADERAIGKGRAPGRAAPSIEPIARGWSTERYEEMENAGADRAADEHRDLELPAHPRHSRGHAPRGRGFPRRSPPRPKPAARSQREPRDGASRRWTLEGIVIGMGRHCGLPRAALWGSFGPHSSRRRMATRTGMGSLDSLLLNEGQVARKQVRQRQAR